MEAASEHSTVLGEIVGPGMDRHTPIEAISDGPVPPKAVRIRDLHAAQSQAKVDMPGGEADRALLSVNAGAEWLNCARVHQSSVEA